ALLRIANRQPGVTPAKGGREHAAARGGGNAAALPGSFTNVRVNDPAADTQQIDQTTQSETAIAASGPNVVAGYNDSQHTGLFFTQASSLSGYSYSTNGGQSFTDGGVLPNRPEFV